MSVETFENRLKQIEEAAYKGCKRAIEEHNMIPCPKIPEHLIDRITWEKLPKQPSCAVPTQLYTRNIFEVKATDGKIFGAGNVNTHPEIEGKRVAEVQFDILSSATVDSIAKGCVAEFYFDTNIFAEQYSITTPDKKITFLIKRDCGHTSLGYKYEVEMVNCEVDIEDCFKYFKTGACWINTVPVIKIHKTIKNEL